MVDCHTHSGHSHDTDVDPEDMVLRAIELGAEYYAITDHSDKDYKYILPQYGIMGQLDTITHIDEILTLKDKYKDKIYLGLGIEVSYCKDAEADYIAQLGMTDRWDIIVNSVHTVSGHDIYYPAFYNGREKRESYNEYLMAVLNSLDAAYNYDTVAHLGYCTRKSIYSDYSMRYSEFKDIIDTILKKIIDLDKTLEINTHCRGDIFIPDINILQRYRELGGDNVTFGSDAHQVHRVLDKYSQTAEVVSETGFKYYTVYKLRRPYKVKI